MIKIKAHLYCVYTIEFNAMHRLLWRNFYANSIALDIEIGTMIIETWSLLLQEYWFLNKLRVWDPLRMAFFWYLSHYGSFLQVELFPEWFQSSVHPSIHFKSFLWHHQVPGSSQCGGNEEHVHCSKGAQSLLEKGRQHKKIALAQCINF